MSSDKNYDNVSEDEYGFNDEKSEGTEAISTSTEEDEEFEVRGDVKGGQLFEPFFPDSELFHILYVGERSIDDYNFGSKDEMETYLRNYSIWIRMKTGRTLISRGDITDTSFEFAQGLVRKGMTIKEITDYKAGKKFIPPNSFANTLSKIYARHGSTIVRRYTNDGLRYCLRTQNGTLEDLDFPRMAKDYAENHNEIGDVWDGNMIYSYLVFQGVGSISVFKKIRKFSGRAAVLTNLISLISDRIQEINTEDLLKNETATERVSKQLYFDHPEIDVRDGFDSFIKSASKVSSSKAKIEQRNIELTHNDIHATVERSKLGLMREFFSHNPLKVSLVEAIYDAEIGFDENADRTPEDDIVFIGLKGQNGSYYGALDPPTCRKVLGSGKHIVVLDYHSITKPKVKGNTETEFTKMVVAFIAAAKRKGMVVIVFYNPCTLKSKTSLSPMISFQIDPYSSELCSIFRSKKEGEEYADVGLTSKPKPDVFDARNDNFIGFVKQVQALSREGEPDPVVELEPRMYSSSQIAYEFIVESTVTVSVDEQDHVDVNYDDVNVNDEWNF